jgi:hypothetical protein
MVTVSLSTILTLLRCMRVPLISQREIGAQTGEVTSQDHLLNAEVKLELGLPVLEG